MPSDCHAPTFTERDIPDLSGYVAIVTGGNSGIGYETAQQLALHNARVYIAGRSRDRVEKAIQQMKKTCAGRILDLRFLELDLKDLRSVKASTATFAQWEPRLDILINNAGVMDVPYELTVDGYELHWQINYLAPFVLTSRVTPLMLASAAQSQTLHRVRVVNVSSDLAFRIGPKKIQFDDVNMPDPIGMMPTRKRYSHSKQASIRHAKELNSRYHYKGVTAYALHPGVIRTNLQNSDPSLTGAAMRTMMNVLVSKTPLEGALNSLYCATSPSAPEKGQGGYFTPVGKLDSKADAFDSEENGKLWRHSEAVLERL